MFKVMRKTLLFIGVSLLLVGAASRGLNYHVSMIQEFSKNIPKGSYYKDVVAKAEEVPFSAISLSEPYWWEEEKTWLAASIDITSSISSSTVSCSIDFVSEITTGEYSCMAYSFLWSK